MNYNTCVIKLVINKHQYNFSSPSRFLDADTYTHYIERANSRTKDPNCSMYMNVFKAWKKY